MASVLALSCHNPLRSSNAEQSEVSLPMEDLSVTVNSPPVVSTVSTEPLPLVNNESNHPPSLIPSGSAEPPPPYAPPSYEDAIRQPRSANINVPVPYLNDFFLPPGDRKSTNYVSLAGLCGSKKTLLLSAHLVLEQSLGLRVLGGVLPALWWVFTRFLQTWITLFLVWLVYDHYCKFSYSFKIPGSFINLIWVSHAPCSSMFLDWLALRFDLLDLNICTSPLVKLDECCQFLKHHQCRDDRFLRAINLYPLDFKHCSLKKLVAPTFDNSQCFHIPVRGNYLLRLIRFLCAFFGYPI